MNLLSVDFYELYRRHLRRHSQFGINVLHLLAVVLIYLSLFGLGFAIPVAGPYVVGVILSLYFVVLLINLPFGVWCMTAITIGVMLTTFLIARQFPPFSYLPIWVHPILIVVWHRFQVWHHSVYDRELDMSAFTGKYQKGFALFILLAVYELPILLNFLVFDRKAEARTVAETASPSNDAGGTELNTSESEASSCSPGDSEAYSPTA